MYSVKPPSAIPIIGCCIGAEAGIPIGSVEKLSVGADTDGIPACKPLGCINSPTTSSAIVVVGCGCAAA